MCELGGRTSEYRRWYVRSIVAGQNGFRRMDSVPTEPEPVAMRDRISVYRQLALDFVVDGTRRHISIAVVPLDCGYQIDYFAIQFVPFCRIQPTGEDCVEALLSHVKEQSEQQRLFGTEMKIGTAETTLPTLSCESWKGGGFWPLIRGDFPGPEMIPGF